MDFEPQGNVKPRDLMASVKVVERDQWKAKSPVGDIPDLKTPIHKIVLTWTDTEPCEFPWDCEKFVQNLQKQHMEKDGLPDIRYNFLVALDKNVYVGRGWNKQGPTYPDMIPGAEEYNGSSVEIAFVDKHMKEPSVDQANILCSFLAREMVNKFIERPISIMAVKDGAFVKFGTLFVEDKYVNEDDSGSELEFI